MLVLTPVSKGSRKTESVRMLSGTLLAFKDSCKRDYQDRNLDRLVPY